MRGGRVRPIRHGPRPREFEWAAGLLLVVGVAFRIRRYAAARSLWIDEAWLALNILTRSFTGLLHRLDFEQTAPVPFLWATRLSVLMFGPGERALRLVALLAGCLLLLAIVPVARRILGRPWEPVAAALCACSPVLIYYSDDVKPYMVDALATTVLLWLALRVMDRRTLTDWVLLGIAGTVALLSSFSAAFVLAAVVAALAISPGRLSTQPGPKVLAGLAVLWALAASAAFATLRQGAWSPYMKRYWANGYLGSPSPHPFQRLSELGAKSIQRDLVALHLPGAGAQTLVLLVLLAVGAVGLTRRAGWRPACWSPAPSPS